MALFGEMKDKRLQTTIISWVKTNLLKSLEFGSAQWKNLALNFLENIFLLYYL